jgi:hypothetical protein
LSARRRWGIGALVVSAVGLVWVVFGAGPNEPAPEVETPGSSADRVRPSDRPGSCPHPYVPSVPGTELAYHWSGNESEGEITMRTIRSTQEAAGWRIRWRMEMTGPSDDRVWSVERACEDDATEEPWLGLGSAGAVRMSDSTWRVPSVLRPGDRYQGTVEASVAGLRTTLTRVHRVEARERVLTEAGSFDAVRVRAEERSPHAAEPTTRIEWIARGPGLVRMEEGAGPMAFTYELVSWRQGQAP